MRARLGVGAVGPRPARVAEALAVAADPVLRAAALAVLRNGAVFAAETQVAEARAVHADPVRRAVGPAARLQLAAKAREAGCARADPSVAHAVARAVMQAGLRRAIAAAEARLAEALTVLTFATLVASTGAACLGTLRPRIPWRAVANAARAVAVRRGARR